MLFFFIIFLLHNCQLPDFKRCLLKISGQERHLARVPKAFLHCNLKQQECWHPMRRKWPPVSSLVASILLKSMGNYHKLPLTSPELTNHLKGLRRVYKQRVLYPWALKTEIEKRFKTSYNSADQNMINRFHLNTDGGKGWGLIIRCIKTESTRKLSNNILIFSGQKPCTRIIKSILHYILHFSGA